VTLQQQNTKKHALLKKIAEKKTKRSTVIMSLCLIIQKRNISKLQILLKKKADVNVKDIKE